MKKLLRVFSVFIIVVFLFSMLNRITILSAPLAVYTATFESHTNGWVARYQGKILRTTEKAFGGNYSLK